MSAQLLHPRKVLRPMRRWYLTQVLDWVARTPIGLCWWRTQREQELREAIDAGEIHWREIHDTEEEVWIADRIARELQAARDMLAKSKVKAVAHG